MGEVRVGIGGWRYPSWRGVWYPPGLPQRRELEFAASRLGTVELNGSFYSLQRPESYARWAAATPDDFVFAVKGGRYVTHLRRLRDPAQALANFFASGVLALGPKLGPVLWQLPPQLAFDPGLVGDFLALLPRTTTAVAALSRQHDARFEGRVLTRTDAERPVRHTIEVRHPSFATDTFRALAAEHGVGVVVADTAGRWPLLLEVTSDVVHVRLHGHGELYTGRYDDAALALWADRVRGWRERADVYVYLDNDAAGHAPFDAERLARLLDLRP
jgi:uncharacterized protein YecE (DUF72 family)